MVVLLGIFVIWPLVYSVYLSLFKISFYKAPKFVGLQFYQYVLTRSGRSGTSIWIGLKYAAHRRAHRHDPRVAARQLHQDR